MQTDEQKTKFLWNLVCDEPATRKEKCAKCGDALTDNENIWFCAKCRIPSREVTKGKTGHYYWVAVNGTHVGEWHEISNDYALTLCNERYMAEIRNKA